MGRRGGEEQEQGGRRGGKESGTQGGGLGGRGRAAVSEEEQTEWQNRDNRKTSSEGSAESGSIVRGEREVERVQ